MKVSLRLNPPSALETEPDSCFSSPLQLTLDFQVDSSEGGGWDSDEGGGFRLYGGYF